MDFFGYQDRARRRTFWYVLFFVLAMVLVVAGVDVAVLGIARLVREGRGFARPADAVPLLSFVTIGVFALVGGGALVKTAQLSQGGGKAVAATLGGRLLNPGTASAADRRLLNVVEEMSIAASLPVPAVYVLEDQSSINAFAAGLTPGDAVIAVTRGAVERLSRDELQGVVGHEFSHVLNGDMRLNLRLMGLVYGLLLMVIAGRLILGTLGRVRGGGKKGDSAILVIAAAGVALLVLGAIGYALGRLIQAATSRQREYLADASAVQFTRNPEGLSGALRKILRAGSRVHHPRTAEASHFFFAKPMSSVFDSHPPLESRLDRLDPGWRDRVEREVMPEEEVAAAAEAAAPRRTRIPMPAGMSPLAPATVSQIVGRLEHADPGRGEAMIASLPPEVREACRDPFSARAAVLAAVADPRPEVAAIGWDALAWSTDAALLAETRRLHAAVAPLGTDATLSVVLLALPALRRMSGGQIDDFLAALRTLVASDGVVTFQEHALAALIALHMGAWPRPAVTTPDDRVTAAAVDLLAALARAGSADAEQADRAFALGVRELGIRGTVSRDPEASWDTFHRALKTVRAGRPDRRRRVVAAAAWTASEDGVIDPTESALLRLIADAVESPLPLLGETYSRG